MKRFKTLFSPEYILNRGNFCYPDLRITLFEIIFNGVHL